MPNLIQNRHIANTATAALVSVLMSPIAAWAQTPSAIPSDSALEESQPTRGEVSADERAAGLGQSPGRNAAEDRNVNRIYQNLMGQRPASSPSGSDQPQK